MDGWDGMKGFERETQGEGQYIDGAFRDHVMGTGAGFF
jgi:hypothetical protein